MPKQTCYEAFTQGKLDRMIRPLPYGYYKLKESFETLVECRAEIFRIMAYMSGKASRYSLMHCTSEDMHKWLKDLPALVAHSMAYELLPGLLTLEKDGSEPTMIANTHSHVERACFDLLDRLESARLKLQGSIIAEYNLMKRSGSTLIPLMDESIALAWVALRASPCR